MGDFVCSVCGQTVAMLKTRNPPQCSRCYYRTYKTPKDTCSRCGKIKHIKKRIDAAHVLCASCHSKEYLASYVRKTGTCSICGDEKRIHGRLGREPVCSGCYTKKLQPKNACSVCGLIAAAAKHTDAGSICRKCYTTPLESCSKCGKVSHVYKRENGKPICGICYRPPTQECSWCHRDKAIFKKVDTDRLCKTCYERWRMANDEKFRTIKCLRKRLRRAFAVFTRTGKLMSAGKYGIDYEAIFQHLGSCPGKVSDYHIDHIFLWHVLTLKTERMCGRLLRQRITSG